MIERVAAWYEQDRWNVAYRLWDEDGAAVEPIVRIPMAVYSRLAPDAREAIVAAGVAFDRMHYPHLSEEAPVGTDRVDTQPGQGSRRAQSSDSGAPDHAPAG